MFLCPNPVFRKCIEISLCYAVTPRSFPPFLDGNGDGHADVPGVEIKLEADFVRCKASFCPNGNGYGDGRPAYRY